MLDTFLVSSLSIGNVEIVFVAVGLVIAFLIGLSGMTGGALLTPALIFLGVQPIVAVGSGLVYSGLTKILGSILHFRDGNVDFRIAGRLLLGSIPGVIAGLVTIVVIRDSFGVATLNRFVSLILGLLLMFAGFVEVIRTVMQKRGPRNETEGNRNGPSRFVSVIYGGIVGVLLELSSVGSGTLVMVLLLRTMNSPKKMVGTNVFYGFVITSIGGALQLGIGTVDILLVVSLFIGSLPGIYLGVKAVGKIPTKALRTLLVVLVIVAGIWVLTSVT